MEFSQAGQNPPQVARRAAMWEAAVHQATGETSHSTARVHARAWRAAVTAALVFAVACACAGLVGAPAAYALDLQVPPPAPLGGDGAAIAKIAFNGTMGAAVKGDGSLITWGNGFLGAKATESSGEVSRPSKVMSSVADVTLGYSTRAAIGTDGALYLWGTSQGLGALGNGQESGVSYTPVRVLSDVVRYETYGSSSMAKVFSAAITEDGSLYMWGSNATGQIGQGEGASSVYAKPTRVDVPGKVVDVACGFGFAVALVSDGSLYAWGYDYYGTLGNGADNATLYAPAKVDADGLPAIVDVEVPSDRSCVFALGEDGSVWAWGNNSQGELGTGDDAMRDAPVDIGLSSIASIACNRHGCHAIDKSGGLWVWGETNKLEGVATSPRKICDGVAKAAVSDEAADPDLRRTAPVVSMAVVKSDGSLWTRGANDGTASTVMRPEFARLGSGFADVVEYDDAFFALKSDGSVWTWGMNYPVGRIGVSEAKSYPSDACWCMPMTQLMAGTPVSEAKITVADKTYTGKALAPAPKVVYGGVALKAGQDYRVVSYSSNVKVGTAKVVVRGTGAYAGDVTATFKVNPKSTKLKKPVASKKSVTVKWAKAKASLTTGYQVRVSQYSNMFKSKVKTVKGAKKTKAVVKGLRANRVHYVQVRVYKKVGGKTYYSSWSTKKKVRTKKA